MGAASLNFNDIDRCRGNLVSVPTPPPFTLGMDVCGVVDAAGEGAESWLGKRVVAITKNALGGIAEYAIADAISVFDAPAGFDDAEATAFLLTFQTSHLALFKRGRLRAARPWWCTPAASGLGTAGIQLGKAAGARVIAVAGGPEKVALCASLGADLVVDHTAEDFVEAVLGCHGRCRGRRRLRPHGGRLRRTLLALHGPRRSLPGRGLRRRRRQRHDRTAVAHGLYRQHRHRGVMLAWVDSVDPGMRRFGFNPFGRDVADEIHADLLRLAAEGRSVPSWAGGSPWTRPGARSTSTRPADRWGGRSSRSTASDDPETPL